MKRGRTHDDTTFTIFNTPFFSHAHRTQKNAVRCWTGFRGLLATLLPSAAEIYPRQDAISYLWQTHHQYM